jgi:hypothetical protein
MAVTGFSYEFPDVKFFFTAKACFLKFISNKEK